MIVVVSHPRDDHAVKVIDQLGQAGHPVRLIDTGDYPLASTLTVDYGGDAEEGPPRFTFTHRQDTIHLDSVGAVWWRRPQSYTVHPGLGTTGANFAYAESHEAISGMWHSLAAAWVNPPAKDEVAHHKPFQLTTAAGVGLPVPRTVITNDPDAARSFVSRSPTARTVYKTFIATEASWRETRELRPAELDLLDTVRLAPVIFQEYVEAEADLRVTIVGHDIWATEIVPAPDGYTMDYRMDLAGATFTPTTLPEPVREKLRSFMHRLGIVYGAVDLRRTGRGEYVFLEVNPAGEWNFVEERTGQPISRSMADLLIRLDHGQS